ncbi:uncharacterized protein LOC143830759 isoform X3 [Paroedura picta]|uniref:uncharacterized protein LOC143830759 isoform X3 n=1 Tax=Paroedura picta TaxID=143630 RepID=UPI00405643E0
MDFAKYPDCIEGLRHRFMQKCTVESVARPASDTNLKDLLFVPKDRHQEKSGQMTHQIDGRQNRRNCTRGAFSVLSTTGSLKLRKRTAGFHQKFSESSGRCWEELASYPDSAVNSLNDRRYPKANMYITRLAELEANLPSEEQKSFQKTAIWVSTGRHADIDMEAAHDHRVNEGLCAGVRVHLPQGSSRSSDHPKGMGAFVEAADPALDPTSLMDIDPSDSAELLQSFLGTPSPLLVAPVGDIPMHNEMGIRKTKEMPILERVGETLRKQKLRATQV